MPSKKVKGAEVITIVTSKGTPIEEIDLTNCVLFEKNGNQEIYIRHPYLSEKLQAEYTDNEYLEQTKKIWEEEAYDRVHPTATLILNGRQKVGKAGNGKSPTMHTIEICERKKLNIPTGQGYHLCDGIHLPENHSEAKAVRLITEDGNAADMQNATAYLYGHWWSCIDCSTALENAGVTKLYISKDWTRKYLEI